MRLQKYTSKLWKLWTAGCQSHKRRGCVASPSHIHRYAAAGQSAGEGAALALRCYGPYNTICSINTAKAKCEIAKISTARHCRHATSGGRTHATYCSGTCNTTEYFRCNAGRQIKHRRRDVALVAEKSPCEDPASDLLTRAVTHLDRCQLANAKGSHQLRR